MNLRKEIEKLILWYIPAMLLVNFLAMAFLADIKSVNGMSFSLTYAMLIITFLIKNIHSIVVAIWLYSLAKRMEQKYILWALFGLVAHLYAAVTFVILNLLEGKFNTGKEDLKQELVERDL